MEQAQKWIISTELCFFEACSKRFYPVQNKLDRSRTIWTGPKLFWTYRTTRHNFVSLSWRIENPYCHKVQSSTKHPLWSPLSANGKQSTRPPYLISFTPYTTPTPLPNRPNWNNEDWLDYFKENHPNFWFQKQLKEKVIRKLNLTSPTPAENDADEDNGNMSCRVFKRGCKIGKIFA